MKSATVLLAAAFLVSSEFVAAEEKAPERRIDQLRAVIKSSCSENGIEVFFASSGYLGGHMLLPHLPDDPGSHGDPAWRIYKACINGIADWAARGERRRSATLPPIDGGEQEVPTKKSNAIHWFRVGQRDLVNVVYLKESEGDSPGSLVIYLIDGAEYAKNEDTPRRKLEIQAAEQDGAGQPATALESKPEGKQEPQPESEVRPR